MVIHNRERLADSPARETALGCLAAGIEAAAPERLIDRRMTVTADTLRVTGVGAADGRESSVSVELGDFDRLIVAGGGKAAAGVARGVTAALGDRIDEGIVVTPNATPIDGPVEAVEGGHPLPTAASVAGTDRLLSAVDEAGPETLILAPITGGGSATLAAPSGVSLDTLRAVTRRLLDRGATIDALNAVRRRLSGIKGGRLAVRAAPATVLGLLVSDVVGDRSVIASGPTVPDRTSVADARRTLARYDIDDPAVHDAVAAGDTPPADHPAFDTTRSVVIGDGRTALRAARRAAIERGARAHIVSDRVTGEARRCGRRAAALATAVAEAGDSHTVLVSGGETTVTVSGDGTGGPNCEYAVAAGRLLAERAAGDRIAVGALDTDGADGSTGWAGGLVDGRTVDPGAARRALAANDAGRLLAAADGAVRTGPTGTNVDDLRVLVIE